MPDNSEFEIDNLPNRLTILRMVLIPIVLALVYFSSYAAESKSLSEKSAWLGALIFILASFTDFLDGHIARKKNITTVFGSFLDPIADKFLTVSVLIMLLAVHRLPVAIVIILVLREMYMTSLRLLGTNQGINIPVQSLGKWKTAVTMMGIPFLMVPKKVSTVPMHLIGTILIYTACILSLWSAVTYSLEVIRKLKQRRQEKKERK